MYLWFAAKVGNFSDYTNHKQACQVTKQPISYVQKPWDIYDVNGAFTLGYSQSHSQLFDAKSVENTKYAQHAWSYIIEKAIDCRWVIPECNFQLVCIASWIIISLHFPLLRNKPIRDSI